MAVSGIQYPDMFVFMLNFECYPEEEKQPDPPADVEDLASWMTSSS